MSNFDCGMGKRCHAFQICYPINSKAWYIAYALQQWNTYYNIYYDAVGYGIAIVQCRSYQFDHLSFFFFYFSHET